MPGVLVPHKTKELYIHLVYLLEHLALQHLEQEVFEVGDGQILRISYLARHLQYKSEEVDRSSDVDLLLRAFQLIIRAA